MTAVPGLNFPIRSEVLGTVGGITPTLVVAVPVKDEEARIEACLASLAGQVEVDFADLAVVLLLNNTTDDTVERVRALAGQLPFALHLNQVELPEGYANAGWARRLAMEAAADLASSDGLILTTDADTLVETDWVVANRREIEAGVDAVAGYVMADPVELMELPAQSWSAARWNGNTSSSWPRWSPGSIRNPMTPGPGITRTAAPPPPSPPGPTAASAACRHARWARIAPCSRC